MRKEFYLRCFIASVILILLALSAATREALGQAPSQVTFGPSIQPTSAPPASATNSPPPTAAPPPAVASMPTQVAFQNVSQPFPPVAPPSPNTRPLAQPSIEELSRRLEAAESRLSELSATQSSDAERSRFRQYWEQVRDPSITTVDQQTRSTGDEEEEEKQWYDRLSLRGYAQFRLNEVFAEEGAEPHYVADRSLGDNQNFLIRRARLIFSGDVSDHLYVYLQPDFASSTPGSPDATYFTQIRDWYGDVYLTTNKVNRIRIGQSKVPFGWENLQSSSNRIPLDRTDGINSAVRNERDLGVFYYWTPEEAQDLFKFVLDEGLKGSGNYGVFGFGIYNGQGGSFAEQNDDVHVISRLAVPYRLASGQIVELGVQAYRGKYAVLSSVIEPLGIAPAARPLGTLETGQRAQLDERVAGTLVWYPQPLGFQTEWNVGRGPGLNDEQTEVIERSLYGGYAMMMYRYESRCYGTWFPFVRYQHFRGGYKAERNAPFSYVDEYELGVEWQLNPQMELTTQYTFTDRTNTAAQSSGRSYEQFEGQILRFQFQMNY
jgi:hypothetical protein